MSTGTYRHVACEYLLPWQLRERLAGNSVIYIPLGTIEWHCEHLPIGLDALTAHGICLRAADRSGGAVLPPLHYGTGGDHGAYPWTIMMPAAAEIEAQLNFTLARLEAMGVKRAVIFSGHFADTQLEMIDRIAANWNAKTAGLKVFATAVNRIEGLDIVPDHAAVFETTLLYALHADLVQLGRLPSLDENPLAEGDVWAAGRHDPSYPLWGVIGPDPRKFDTGTAAAVLEKSVAWLVRRVRDAA